MMVYVKVDENSRLTAVADPGFHCGEGELEVEFPEGFAPPLHDYKLVDGVIVYDPLPVPEEPETMTPEQRIAALEEQIDMLLSGVTADE